MIIQRENSKNGEFSFFKNIRAQKHRKLLWLVGSWNSELCSMKGIGIYSNISSLFFNTEACSPLEELYSNMRFVREDGLTSNKNESYDETFY